MTIPRDLSKHFLELHRKGRPLLLANVWDAGSARLIASLGFEALATTSSGHAGTLGRRDGRVTREEALAHAREIAAATELPLNADLERCFADTPEGAAETLRLAGATGIAGASIEDSSGDPAAPIYAADLARARVEAAVEAARAAGFVLTARCENYLHGRRDLADTIARLQAFEAAGADVLYAPGLTDLAEIRTLVASLGAPVNVLFTPKGPTVADLASVGVARISVGGAFYYTAMGALVEAAREWREQGTQGFWQRAIVGMGATRAAFER
jgi:2-methylisocitrate lyase-like PEP mutase family enzyme